MAFHTSSLLSVFGSLGMIISFMVFLAPVPTFYQIFKKKSTEGFQALPYIVALFSSMLLIYYALLKEHEGPFIFIINSFGCVIETIYLLIFLIYASNNIRLSTMKIILLLDVFGYGAMLLSTYYLISGPKRLNVIGWIMLVFNISVFAAPLGSLRQVIKTKSVEFMPISLSFFLTLNAVMWFFYGFFDNDYFIALPNILGFLFGIIQMVLYAMYRKNKKVILEEDPVKSQELSNNNNNNNGHIIDVVKLGTMTPSPSFNTTNHHESRDVVVNVTTIDEVPNNDGNNQEQGNDDSHKIKKTSMDNNNSDYCKV